MRRSQMAGPTRRLVPEASTARYFTAIFLAVFVATLCLGYLTLTLVESSAREQLLGSIETAERQGVNAMAREARETLVEVTADLLVFRSLIEHGLASESRSSLSEQTLLDFMQNQRVYDQIRFIDLSGRERIRVDNEDDGPRLLPADELQNKSQSRYFRDATSLAANEVLISQLEPNREYGRIELPLNPVIRVVTRAAAVDGGASGFIVLNYRARNLLDNMASIGAAALGEPMVVTGKGLDALAGLSIGTPEALTEAQSAPSFAERFPEAWATINLSAAGVASDGAGGIMVFTRFFPAEEAIPAIFVDPLTWTLPRDDDPEIEGGLYLVSHMDSAAVAAITRLSSTRSPAVLALFMLVVFALAWMVALRMSNLRSDSARMHKLATRDALTGLLTRGEFERRLDAALSHAERHHRAMALLYVDLDNFKEVNDTLGHAAGDNLLRHVAELLRTAVRSSDFVGRVGGDEFAVALTEIRGRSDTQVVAQKLRERLVTSMPLAGGQVNIGGSVGSATFPDDAKTAEELFDRADQAMYEDKPQAQPRSATA